MRIAIDVGGTFTDAVAVDGRGRLTAHLKVPSTPPEVQTGALAALEDLSAGRQLERVVHGTTIATNALIEGSTAKVGLLTTEGFRDVLAVGSQMRPDLYDVMQAEPAPIVPRRVRLEIPERIAADGGVVRALDEKAVARAARRLRRERVDAVAVCFLFSYTNPDHERRAAEILRTVLPHVHVALSCDIAPMIREFPRTSTTVINAALRPLVSRYLRDLQEHAGTTVLVMQSNGGVLPADVAASQAHLLLTSGPAAGVVGATAFPAANEAREVVTMDMGGTSFDTCVVVGGRPTVRGESSVGGRPVLGSAVDLVTVGAGGGSLAWVDGGGALRVGPRSAGAVPGPACYNRGGSMPTVTDANVVIGRLVPERFLEGRVQLDRDAAERAIADHVARPLGSTVESAALAILEVTSATMARALRVVTIGRGRDPATLPLVAFGGAGPLHAVRLAEELGAPRILIPPLPGFVSALGLLATELRTEVAETVLRPGGRGATPDELRRSASRMSRTALRRLDVDPQKAAVSLSVDVRYEGQGYELTVPLAATTIEGVAAARGAFDRLHDAVYGHSAPNEPVELVALRVTVAEPGAGFQATRVKASRSPVPTTVRKVFGRVGWQDVPAFDRNSLPAAWRDTGPALILEGESSTWVPAGWSLAVDGTGTMEVTRVAR